MVPHQGGLLSEWSHEGGFIRWSHIRVASYQSGLMRVVSAGGLSLGGLSLGWSIARGATVR